MFRQIHWRYAVFVLNITLMTTVYGSLYHHQQLHYPTLSPYTSLFQHVIQHNPQPDNPIATNLRYLAPNKNVYPSVNYVEPQYLHSSIGNPFALPPLLSGQLSDLTYIVDGRILKQYLVMENHNEDNTLDAFLNDPVNRNAYVPYLPHLNLNRSDRPNLGFPNDAGRSGQLIVAAGPAQSAGQQIAVGSGSLGFVRHANGAVYLGSGSLGYNDDQQRTAAVQNRNGQSPAPSPLSFGHNPQ